MNEMMKRNFRLFSMLSLLGCLLLIAATAGQSWATSGPRGARGDVVDSEGNPIVGAEIIFTAMESANSEPVSAKTNKKGRFFAPNLFSTQGDRFKLEVKMEGMLPVAVRLESRSVNKVLIGDITDKKLTYGQSLPNVFIRPLGEGIVSLTLAPESEVMAAAQETMNAIAATSGEAASGDGAATPAAPPARDAWDEALSLAGDGDYAEAVPFFEKAIEKQPEEYDRREAYAKVLYQLERFDDAQAQAQAAVEINPNAISPRMVMYSSYVSQKAYDDAKRVLNEAREIAPENLNVLEQLAYVSLQQNNKQEAISSYEQIVALDAEKTDAWIQLGDLYAQTGQSDKSEQAFEKVSELAPDDAHQVFFNIGALLVNKPDRTDADTKKAIDSFRKAIELKPSYGEAHKQLAFALLGTGDSAGAKAALQQYVAVAPNAPDAAQMKSLADAM